MHNHQRVAGSASGRKIKRSFIKCPRIPSMVKNIEDEEENSITPSEADEIVATPSISSIHSEFLKPPAAAVDHYQQSTSPAFRDCPEPRCAKYQRVVEDEDEKKNQQLKYLRHYHHRHSNHHSNNNHLDHLDHHLLNVDSHSNQNENDDSNLPIQTQKASPATSTIPTLTSRINSHSSCKSLSASLSATHPLKLKQQQQQHQQQQRRQQRTLINQSSFSPYSSFLNLFLTTTTTLIVASICLIQLCDSQFVDTTNEVVYVDLRVKENSIQHHTILYEQIDHLNPLNPTGPSMVLRRGEQFNIIIHLKQNYNKNTDKIRLEFSFGPRPQVGKGTLIYLPIAKDRDSFGRDPSKWDARVLRVDGNQLNVQINLPANIAIGVWRFRISTKLAGSRTIRTFSIKEALYIIFNAWSKDDAVYLSREDARQEYVLNDVGKIYIGSHSKPRGRKWIYGQFHESVLPAVMFMLDKTRLDIVGRANVVKVARAVSAMVNSHDDNGLLVGNWSGNYGDGLAPWQWTGSATILEKYLQSGGEPVKFGQCWVFAGVTTTALRTLGIPARTVSNFVSAHDTDDSLTVDKFFSEKGDPISDVNSDSIWNFHVWSDAWMARTDLPPGYGGWQAVDATPQETSMGMYQMGPASLEAIKKGEVGFAYDAAFVFAEVNADIVHWQQDDKSELQWKKIKTLKFHIGRKIFTKMIGQLDDYTANGVADAEDIISQYKNKEGTEDERMSVLNAARCGGLGFLFEQPAPGKEDVEFELYDIDKVMIGEPFLVTVRIINRSPMRRTVSLALSASSVYYTGILAQKVKRDRQNIVLNGLQEQIVRIRVNPEDYLERLVDYSMMKIYAIATVKETQQTWSKEDDFMIEKPLAS